MPFPHQKQENDRGYRRRDGVVAFGFQTNEDLEIYYDIGKAGRTIAYISKGWEDPGFRIGDTMILEEQSLDAFRRKSDKVLNVCATLGIACGAQVIEGDKVQLDFSICI